MVSTPTSPLQLTAFRRVMFSNLVHLVATATVPIALAFAVLSSDGDAMALGLVLAANTVPPIFFLIFGGVLADRSSRSKILFVGRLVNGAICAAMALMMVSGTATTARITLFSFAAGVANSFTAPAAQGIVPQVVPVHLLQQANTLIRLPMNAVKVIGPLLGGVVVAVTSPGLGMLVASAAYVVSGLWILGMKLPAVERQPSRLLADLRDGWTDFRSMTWLWVYTLSGTLIVMFWLAGFQLLGPVVAAASYGGAASWGIVQSSLAVGLLLGASLCLRWQPYRLLAISVTGSAGLALPLLAMGAGAPLALVAVAALATGVLLDVSIICWTTAMQMHLPEESLGRLTAFNGVGERLAIPIGYLLVGLTVNVLTPSVMLLVCGAVIVLVTIATLLVPAIYHVNRIGQPVEETDKPLVSAA